MSKLVDLAYKTTTSFLLLATLATGTWLGANLVKGYSYHNQVLQVLLHLIDRSCSLVSPISNAFQHISRLRRSLVARAFASLDKANRLFYITMHDLQIQKEALKDAKPTS